MYFSTPDLQTAMSKRHHGHTHTLEDQRGAEEEEDATNAPKSLLLWRSPLTWKRRKRRGAITQTTLPHLPSRSSTALSSDGATIRMNTKVQILSRNPAPLLNLLLPTKRSATPNQTKNPTVTTITPRKTGTGTKSGGGNEVHRQVVIEAEEEEEEKRDLKGRNTARTERGVRVRHRSPQSTARSPVCMRARERKRREEMMVSVFTFTLCLRVNEGFLFLAVVLMLHDEEHQKRDKKFNVYLFIIKK